MNDRFRLSNARKFRDAVPFRDDIASFGTCQGMSDLNEQDVETCNVCSC